MKQSTQPGPAPLLMAEAEGDVGESLRQAKNQMH